MDKYIGRQKQSRKRKRRRLLKLLIFFTAIVLIYYAFILSYESSIFGGAVEEEIDDTGSGAFIQTENNKSVRMGLYDIYRGDLLLVNSDHKYRFANDQDLVSVFDFKSASYSVAGIDILLDRKVVESLNDMLDDFYEETGNNHVNIVSGYRTYQYQEHLYEQEVAEKGEAEAMTRVAMPAYSEHHLGLAVDLAIYNENGTSEDIVGTDAYEWLSAHSYRYGFVIRYGQDKSDITGISNEPWHFRFVGIPHAFMMTQKEFCFEEYIDYLKGFEDDGEHLIFEYNDVHYEIYYTENTSVHVPDDKEYEISGNNLDGFIVTVQW